MNFIAGIGTKFHAAKAEIQQHIKKAKIGKKAYDTGMLIANVAKFIGSRTDVMARTARVGIPVIELVETVAAKMPNGESLILSLAPLKGRLKTVKDVARSTNIFERGKEWANPVSREGFLKSRQKTASRVFLTGGQIIDAIVFIDRLKFNYLSQISFTLGAIPILGTIGEKMFPVALIKDGLITLAAIMGIWDCSITLRKLNKEWKTAKTKKKQWFTRQQKMIANRPMDLSTINACKVTYKTKIAKETEKEINKQDKKKIEQWKKYVKLLEGRSVFPEVNRTIAAFEEKVSDFESEILDANVSLRYAASKKEKESLRAKLMDNQEALKKTNKALEEAKVSLTKLKQFSQMTKAIRAKRSDLIIRHKIEKHDIRLTNKTNGKTKQWVSVASDIAKLIIITLATACLVTGLSKFLIPALLVGFFGTISESLGVAKAIYVEFAPKPKLELGHFFYA